MPAALYEHAVNTNKAEEIKAQAVESKQAKINFTEIK